MHQLYKRFCLQVCFTSLFFSLSAFGQPTVFQKLEEKVYQLNNSLKYNESQALLLPVLQNETYSVEEKYQAAILLSYTYKRLYDYSSALKFLGIAKQFAQETDKKREYTASILAEEAFVRFDTHDYKRSDSLMKILEKTDFQFVDRENKSKLVMQQGYLLFLNNQFKEAEATYDRAIQLMKSSAICHLPMIYVKKMQLYNAMNRLDLMDVALKQSTFYADSCSIIKYDIYAHEELLAIYEKRNDLTKIVATRRKLDTLNSTYATQVNLTALHEQKESILLGDKEQKLKDALKSQTTITILLVGLLILTIALVGWLVVFRRQKQQAEHDIARMKAELESYLANKNEVIAPKPDTDRKPLYELSDRQQEVLDCMAVGMSNKEIADKLYISTNTVKYHIKNIYQLLEIKDRKDFLVNIKK